MKKEVLRISNVTIENEGITFLNNLNLYITEGEVVGLIAKSYLGIDRLIKLICENVPLKHGRVYINNDLVNSYIHRKKSENQVYLIDQKSRLIKELTVLENIFVIRKRSKKLLVNSKNLSIPLDTILEELNLSIDPKSIIGDLSIFDTCVVELIKAEVTEASLIIIRNISEKLNVTELTRFHEILKYFSRKGFSFLYLENHHKEIFKVCDRVVLYDDGKIVKNLFKEEMLDEYITPFFKHINTNVIHSNKKDDVLLKYTDISTNNINNFNLEIISGECLALLDCNPSFINDFISITKGDLKLKNGKILYENNNTKITKNWISKNILIIPETPLINALFYQMSYMENLCFLIDKKIEKIFIGKKYYKSIKTEFEEELGTDINTNKIDKLSISSLYNIIYYRILIYKPKIAFIVSPFHGADMYLRIHIAKLIIRLKKEGIAVVLLTNQITDVLSVSDRFEWIENQKIDTFNEITKE